MIPNIGLPGTVDYIKSKMGLGGKQDATNNLGVNVNPMANFHPATHVSRFKILNALDVVRISVLPCVLLCRLSTPNNQKGDNSLCTSAWTSLYHVNYMFVFFHFIVLGSSERRTPPGDMLYRRWSSKRANTSRRVIRRRDPVAITQQQQQQQQCCYHYKTHTKCSATDCWTLLTAITDCSLCYRTHCWRCNITWIYLRLSAPPTLQLSLHQEHLQIATMFTWHLYLISVLDTLRTKQ